MGQNRDELCTVDDYLYDAGIQRLLYEERNIASILCEKGTVPKVFQLQHYPEAFFVKRVQFSVCFT